MVGPQVSVLRVSVRKVRTAFLISILAFFWNVFWITKE